MKNNLKTATEVIEEVTKEYVDKYNGVSLGKFAEMSNNPLRNPFDVADLIGTLEDNFSSYFFYHEKIQALPVLACKKFIEDKDDFYLVLDHMNEDSLPFLRRNCKHVSDYVTALKIKDMQYYGLSCVLEAVLVEAEGFENIKCVADINFLLDKEN